MIKVLLIVAIVALIVVCAPFATIWSLNTLFPVLNIPYNFDTWIASLLLFGLTRVSTQRDSK